MHAQDRRAAPFDHFESILGHEHVAFRWRCRRHGLDGAARWRKQPRQGAARGRQVEQVARLQFKSLLKSSPAIGTDTDEFDGRETPFTHDDRQRAGGVDGCGRSSGGVAFARIERFDVASELLCGLRKG